MSETSEQKKRPSQIIFENLRELMHAKNTAHESMFKFHWKKMWPFNLFWPQVDFVRIERLMGEIQKNCVSQKNLVLQAKPKSMPYEANFLKAVPAYLDALDTSCKLLAEAAHWKQDWRLKKKRNISDWARILKEYETAQGNLTRAGAFVQVGWQEFVSAGGFVSEPPPSNTSNVSKDL